MDTEAPAIQEDESPETTIARTRSLLARSRATLDILARRLSRYEPSQDPPTHPAPGTSP